MADDTKTTETPEQGKPAPAKRERKQYVTVHTNPEKVKARHAAFTTPNGETIGREPVKVERSDFVDDLLLKKHLLEG